MTCTGGEEGEIHDPDLDHEEAKPRLAEIRREELQCSLDALRGGGPGSWSCTCSATATPG